MQMLLLWRPHLEKCWFEEQSVFSLPVCSIPSSSLLHFIFGCSIPMSLSKPASRIRINLFMLNCKILREPMGQYSPDRLNLPMLNLQDTKFWKGEKKFNCGYFSSLGGRNTVDVNALSLCVFYTWGDLFACLKIAGWIWLFLGTMMYDAAFFGEKGISKALKPSPPGVHYLLLKRKASLSLQMC